MAGDTTAPPQSATTATRRPRRSSAWVPSPGLPALDAGRLNGSLASCPLATSNQRAVSRTERDTHPVVDV